MKKPFDHNANNNILPFKKPDWEFEDYTILTHRTASEDENGNLHENDEDWVAIIKGWMIMIGTGVTKEEAYEDLKRRFYSYKNSGKKLPRPGTMPPVEFAPNTEMEQYKDIAIDFFDKVFDMDYLNGYFCDGTTVYELGGEPPEVIRLRVLNYYNLDISDIEGGDLITIFKRIKQDGGNT